MLSSALKKILVLESVATLPPAKIQKETFKLKYLEKI